jgi:hypothetical protein
MIPHDDIFSLSSILSKVSNISCCIYLNDRKWTFDSLPRGLEVAAVTINHLKLELVARFYIFTAMKIQVKVFWFVTL